MSTERQKRLAQLMMENPGKIRPLTAIEMLEEAGYSNVVARASASRTMREDGVLAALAEHGFTEENAKGVVTQIMADEEADGNVRLKAADMMFKVKGSYAPEKKELSGSVATTSLTPEQLAKINALALDDQ